MQKLIEGQLYWVRRSGCWHYLSRFIRYEGNDIIMEAIFAAGHHFKTSLDKVDRVFHLEESPRPYKYKEGKVERG